MGIREDFFNYFDGNDMNTPAVCIPIPNQFGSDNNMYTSEYYLMLSKNKELTENDKIDYENKINKCINQGLLNRVPVGQNDGIEGPDDYVALFNACIELGNTDIPQTILKACIKFKGALNNVSPGTWTWQSFLIRQPQILAAMISASFPSFKNPAHWLIRLICFPLFFYSSFIIGFSCFNIPIEQTDPRRLGWHLQNNLKKVSLLCGLASKIWLARLKKDYSNKMNDVAGIYYQPTNNNPYQKWWVT